MMYVADEVKFLTAQISFHVFRCNCYM